MTAKEIQVLPPGYELDELVAIHVMGMVKRSLNLPPPDENPSWFGPEFYSAFSGDGYDGPCPKFSTDWGAMGKLLTFLDGQNFAYAISGGYGQCLVTIALPDKSTWPITQKAIGKTQPHAVALAALLATDLVTPEES